MSVAVIIAVVMVAVIVVALVVVVVRRQAEQRQVVRDRMASAPPDIVRKQTLWPPGLRNWARKPRFLRGKATEAAASAELEVARAKELDARATQAEQRALRAGQGAGRHDAQAAELGGWCFSRETQIT